MMENAVTLESLQKKGLYMEGVGNEDKGRSGEEEWGHGSRDKVGTTDG